MPGDAGGEGRREVRGSTVVDQERQPARPVAHHAQGGGGEPAGQDDSDVAVQLGQPVLQALQRLRRNDHHPQVSPGADRCRGGPSGEQRHLTRRRPWPGTGHMVLGAVTAGDEHVSGARLDEIQLARIVALDQHGRAGAETATLQSGQRGGDIIGRNTLEQRHVLPASPADPVPASVEQRARPMSRTAGYRLRARIPRIIGTGRSPSSATCSIASPAFMNALPRLNS
jgi:hypothetical protein